MSDMKNRAGCAKIAQPYNKLGMTEPAPPRKLMTDPSSSGGGDQPLGLIELPQRQKVVLVMDLVESVRLMAANERAVIDHWRGFVQHATTDVLPRHRGRMVKSLGDGIMAEFDSARDGTNAALALQRFFDGANATLPHDQQLYLRAGLNATHVYVDDIDIYGSGVNLAARVAGLAGPGEVMVTAEVRDGLTDGLDAVVEDMGECYLKHVAEPVRAYRVGPAGLAPILQSHGQPASNLWPTLAVVPLACRYGGDTNDVVGELVADSLITRMSRSRELRVVSRLSTSAVRGRPISAIEIGQLLGANFILSGGYVLLNQRVRLSVELAESKSARVIWADELEGAIGDLLSMDSEMMHRVAAGAHGALLNHAVEAAMTQPLPTLHSFTALLAALTMMHRTSASEFERAQHLLQLLVDRHPRHAAPHAWLANWYSLSMTQGHTQLVDRNVGLAFSHAQRAVDLDPHNALALAINGILHTNLRKDADTARVHFDQAVTANASEPLAWLYKSVLHGFAAEGDAAREASQNALALSPMDPMRHYYESLAATALLGAGDYAGAQVLAIRSMKTNCMHPSTYRALAIAQAMQGQMQEAATPLTGLKRLVPGYTLSAFRENTGFKISALGDQFARALQHAGLDG